MEQIQPRYGGAVSFLVHVVLLSAVIGNFFLFHYAIDAVQISPVVASISIVLYASVIVGIAFLVRGVHIILCWVFWVAVLLVYFGAGMTINQHPDILCVKNVGCSIRNSNLFIKLYVPLSSVTLGMIAGTLLRRFD